MEFQLLLLEILRDLFLYFICIILESSRSSSASPPGDLSDNSLAAPLGNYPGTLLRIRESRILREVFAGLFQDFLPEILPKFLLKTFHGFVLRIQKKFLLGILHEFSYLELWKAPTDNPTANPSAVPAEIPACIFLGCLFGESSVNAYWESYRNILTVNSDKKKNSKKPFRNTLRTTKKYP